MNEMMKINNIYNVDCLVGMKNLKDESIDLIYLDPPFFTQKTHSLQNKSGIEYSFNDKWNDIDEYISFLKIRFIEMKRLLKKTGNIFVHCDKKASHRIRLALEEVFGANNFQSEIVWSYKRWSNSKKGLLDGHQSIYHFSKTKDFKFNTEYKEYSATTNLDQILQKREKDKNGKSQYKKDEVGNIVFSNNKKGVPLNDVWEIPFLNPKANERVGYPTQKPLYLLEQIIKISTNVGDIVLDPFLGSGTTAVAAKILERNYIGFDISQDAIILSQSRINNPIKTESDLLKKGISAYDTKSDKEKEILKRFDCDIVQRNKGLDGIIKRKNGSYLIGVKIQRPAESINDACLLLQSAVEKKSFEYSIVIRTHDDIEEVKKYDKIIIVDDVDYLLKKSDITR